MVDARGLLCPMPVVMVQKEVKANHPDALEVLFDDKGALDNVTRYATGLGYKAACTEENGDYKLVLTK